METVEHELKQWGELIITTEAGESYEIHIGDTEFDTDRRVILLTTPQEKYVIDGDSVAAIAKHYGHKSSD